MTVNQLIGLLIVIVVGIILWDEYAYKTWKETNPGWIFSAELVKNYAPPPSPDVVPIDPPSPFWRFR